MTEGLDRIEVNGPVDRPWGRNAAFADPAGHAWEVAQLLPECQ
jgi:hypothetical protein